MTTKQFIFYAISQDWYVDKDWNGDIQVETPNGLVIISDGKVIEGEWIYNGYILAVDVWVILHIDNNKFNYWLLFILAITLIILIF